MNISLRFRILKAGNCTHSLSESHLVVSNSLQPHGLYSPWNSPGQNTGVGSLSLLQGIFPTQCSNPGLSHSRQILYLLNHKGSPQTNLATCKFLEVAHIYCCVSLLCTFLKYFCVYD